jgi:hypothetical protein
VSRWLWRVNELQLQAIRVCKIHRIVAIAIVGMVRRRIENRRSNLDEQLV